MKLHPSFFNRLNILNKIKNRFFQHNLPLTSDRGSMVIDEYGKEALEKEVGVQFNLAWKSNRHRARRLLAEFIGTCGLTFALSGTAAILASFAGMSLHPYQYAFLLSSIAALWLVASIYFLGDISSHFNPAITLAFALRGDMGWPMTCVYFFIQLSAAAAGSLLAKFLFGDGGNLAATFPHPGQEWHTVLFEAVLTFGLILVVLNMANGAKLNSKFIPLAVGAYIMAAGIMSGPYDGAGFNPARSFGPDFARGDFSSYWVYVLGAIIGVLFAVLITQFLRGPAKAEEAKAAMGTPIEIQN